MPLTTMVRLKCFSLCW